MKHLKSKILICLCMVFVLGLTACGKQKEPENEETTEKMEEVKQISADTILSYYDFKVDDYVTLCDYNNIEIKLDKTYDVTDEDVVTYMNSYLSQSNEYTKNDKQTVENGDCVNIDYVGYIDNQEFAGGSDKSAHLQIGSKTFIDGFEEGLIGANVGDEVTLNLSFKDDYWNSEYQGKAVKFVVKVNYLEDVKVVDYDSVTDEYIKTTFGFDSKTEWYDATKENMISSMQQQKTTDVQNQILKYLVDNSKVEIPDVVYQTEIDLTMKEIEEFAKETYNLTIEEYLKQYENFDSIESFKNSINETLTNNLKQQLILDAIIKDTNMSITEGGYAQFLAYYLDTYALEEKEFYEKYGGKEKIMLIYAENMAISQLTDKYLK